MPPLKKSDKSFDAKIPVQKPPKAKKKRVKVEKPKLKTPTVLKIKIQKKSEIKVDGKWLMPVTSTLLAPPTAAQSKAQNAVQRKIELANEVALSQLAKKSSPQLCPLANSLLTTETMAESANKKKGNEGDGVKKKRGRKKKVVDPTVVAIKTEAKQPPDCIPGQPVTVEKKQERKRRSQQNPKFYVYEEPFDFLFEEPMKKRKKTAIKKPKKVVTKPSKSTSKTRIKKVLPQKANLKDEILAESPSLLINENEIPYKTEESMEVKEMDSLSSTPAAISRVNSYASECPSWAKDISSSSTTTTCTTVQSDDVAKTKIDKRLPIVKLDNIDEQLRSKGTIAADSDDSSSSDSSDSITKCTGSNLSNTVSRSLNLSRSSNSNADKTAKEFFDDFDTHPEELIDLDFLKGLAKGSENITDKDIKALMDDDWPDDEREVIVLCQELRNILKTDVKEFAKVSDKESMGYDKEFTITRTIVNNENSNSPLHKTVLDNDSIEMSNTTFKKLFDNIGTTSKKHYEPIKRTVVINNNISNNITDTLDINTTTKMNDQEMEDRTHQEIVETTNKIQPNHTDNTNENQNNKDPNMHQEISMQSPTKQFEKQAETDWFCERSINYSDDDDVLSLTAESITGLESSRIYSSEASVCTLPPSYDEYQPKPQPKKTIQYKYVSGEDDFNPEAICEKGNEDIEEIIKENQQQRHFAKDSSQYKPWTKGVELLKSSYTRSHPSSCQVLRGVCFYNLMSNCKNPHCRYLHAQLDRDVVLNRLESLPNHVLICDYMLIRGYDDLRKQFGLLFVDQFRRRNLTRVLVEMVIDFISSARSHSVEDRNLTIMITESTLEHLNDVDLSECEDLLHYRFSFNTLLCDKLMEALAETQNFSRFKEVFIKLANFMIGIGKSFDVSVSSQILLRVCNLPFDPALVTSVWQIICNTNDMIFGSSSMMKFEKYVAMVDTDLHDQFLAKKQIASDNHPELILRSPKTPKTAEIERDFKPNMVQQKVKFTSPDSTKMENLQQPQKLQTIQNHPQYQPIQIHNKPLTQRANYPILRAPVAFRNFKIPCLSTRKVAHNMEYRSPLQRPSFRWKRGVGGGYRPSFVPRGMKTALRRQVAYDAPLFARRPRPGPSQHC